MVGRGGILTCYYSGIDVKIPKRVKIRLWLLHVYYQNNMVYSLIYLYLTSVCSYIQPVGAFATLHRLEYHIFTSQENNKHKISIRNLELYGIICTMVTIQ